MIKFLGAACAAVLLSGAASAATITYNVAGTLSNGTRLFGSFDFDGMQSGAAQFSNIYIEAESTFAWGSVYGNNVGQTGDGHEYAYFWAGRDGDFIRLDFPTVDSAAGTTISGTQLGDGSYAYYYYNDFSVNNGTVTAAVAPVPEPATWAMLTLGFGGLGYSMRRKKVTTRVRFA